MKTNEDFRWKAVIKYRRQNGSFDFVVKFVNEIYELHEFIESGPHFATIGGIEITYNKTDYTNLTIEQAEEL